MISKIVDALYLCVNAYALILERLYLSMTFDNELVSFSVLCVDWRPDFLSNASRLGMETTSLRIGILTTTIYNVQILGHLHNRVDLLEKLHKTGLEMGKGVRGLLPWDMCLRASTI